MPSSEEVKLSKLFFFFPDSCRKSFQGPANYLSLRMMPLLLLLVFFHRLHFIICSLLIFYVSSGEARSVQRSHLRVPFALSDARSSRGCWQGLLVGSTENGWQVHTAPGFHQTSLLEHDGIFHTYLFVGPLTLWTDAVHKRIQPLARTSQGFLLSLPPHL